MSHQDPTSFCFLYNKKEGSEKEEDHGGTLPALSFTSLPLRNEKENEGKEHCDRTDEKVSRVEKQVSGQAVVNCLVLFPWSHNA